MPTILDSLIDWATGRHRRYCVFCMREAAGDVGTPLPEGWQLAGPAGQIKDPVWAERQLLCPECSKIGLWK